MSNEPDVFNFHLNESLYFEKGQEVSQMMGISLEPDISIQPYDEYVSIRGVIELQGEYEKDSLIKQMESEPIDFADHSRRYVEKIEATEDNCAIFSHRFPVEISVPSYRVESIDDITVEISMFDYELPDANHLKLISTIAINGISNQVSFRDNMESKPMDGSISDEIATQPDEHFEFDLKADEINSNVNVKSNDAANKLDDQSTDEDAGDRWKIKNKTQTLEEFFKKEEPPEKTEKKNEKIVDDIEETSTPEITEDLEDVETFNEETTSILEESDLELEEREEQLEETILATEELEEQSDDKAESDIDYLATLFRNENEADENEQYSQMRICIVQDHDTLETIAERYKVSKLQLLKQNRLSDDEVSTGQLLSIPTHK